MRVDEIMSRKPVCCAPDTPLPEIARLMVEKDCGAIPITRSGGCDQLVGIVTDRDMVCRALAKGKNPMELRAADVMSSPVVTILGGADLVACSELMEENQIRRIVVTDVHGTVCGMVAQADLAAKAPDHETAEVVKAVSEHTKSASRVSPAWRGTQPLSQQPSL